MRIGVFGTGDVGRALGRGFLQLGHEVKMGSRSARNDKLVAWVADSGERASGGTFAEAAGFGEILVLATLGMATERALGTCRLDDLRGKVIIDATNPLDFSQGHPPRLAVGHTDSAGERIQRLVGSGRVVKAFNAVGAPHMMRPDFPGGPPDMFICGNDPEAKATVAGICHDFGWGVVDLGGIHAARYIEPMCMVWVLRGVASGDWNHAFKLLHK